MITLISAPPLYDLSTEGLAAVRGFTLGTGRSLSERRDNATAWLALFAHICESGRQHGNVRIEGRIELDFTSTQAAAVTLTGQARPYVYSASGEGLIKCYPDFQPYAFSPFRLPRGPMPHLYNLTLEGPDHPGLVDAILCQPASSSATLTRVSGSVFDADFHVGATVHVNYFVGSSREAVSRTITAVAGDGQSCTLSSAMPSGITATPAEAGIFVDYTASPEALAYLISVGQRWTITVQDAGILIPSTDDTPYAPGTVILQDVTIRDFYQGIQCKDSAASIDVEGGAVSSHAEGVQFFCDHALEPEEQVHWHARGLTIHDTAFAPVGRSPAAWSSVLGHATYFDQYLNERWDTCTIRDSRGTFRSWQSGADERRPLYRLLRNCAILRCREGWLAGSIDTAQGPMMAWGCTITDTLLRDAFGLRMVGGAITHTEGFVSDIDYFALQFNAGGNGAALARERLIHLRDVALSIRTPLIRFGAFAETPAKSFRLLLEGCTTVIDQTEQTGAFVSVEGTPYHTYDVELRGGSCAVTSGTGFGTLSQGVTLRLSQGVALSGNPTDAAWVTPGSGTLDATAGGYTLTSTKPLTP